MAVRMMQEKVCLGEKYNILLKRYEKSNKDIPDEEVSAENDGEPKSKEPKLEALDGGSVALQNPALDFQANKDIHRWGPDYLP